MQAWFTSLRLPARRFMTCDDLILSCATWRWPPKLLALALTALGLNCYAAPQDFVIDSAHSFATFEVSHLGISTQRGRVGNVMGTAMLDEVLGTGNIKLTLDARSLSTGNEFMEKLLRSDSWFNTEQFPVVVFTASSFSFIEQKPVRIDGQLTLRGVTQPVSLDVVSYACTRKPFGARLTCGMDANTVIKRADFGMDSYAAFVGNEVKLLIQAEAVRQETPTVKSEP